jgi:hypothetical protein
MIFMSMLPEIVKDNGCRFAHGLSTERSMHQFNLEVWRGNHQALRRFVFANAMKMVNMMTE